MTSDMRDKGIRLAVAVLGAVILIGYQNCGAIKFSKTTESLGSQDPLSFDLSVPLTGVTNESLTFTATNIRFNSDGHDMNAPETVTWTVAAASPVVANPGIMSFAVIGNHVINVKVEKDGESAEKQFSVTILDDATSCSYSELNDSNFICNVTQFSDPDANLGIGRAHCYVRINELANLVPHPVYDFEYSVDIAHGDLIEHEGPLAQNSDKSIDYDLTKVGLYDFTVKVHKDSCSNSVDLHNVVSTGGGICPRGQSCDNQGYEWRCTCSPGRGFSTLCYDSGTGALVNDSFCVNAAPAECTQQICDSGSLD